MIVLTFCVFIKKEASLLVVFSIYVDDINFIGPPAELRKAIYYLKKEYEMKDLWTKNYVLIHKLNI